MGHQSVRDRGGIISVMYEMHWKGLLRPSWEREMVLQHSRHQVLLYWAGTPNEHRRTNRLYRNMRTRAVTRKLSRAKGERFLPNGYALVTHDTWAARFHNVAILPIGHAFGTRPTTDCGGSETFRSTPPRRDST